MYIIKEIPYSISEFCLVPIETRIENGTQTCGHTAPEQSNSGVLLGRNIGGNLRALTRCDKGF
ncbi:MAG: hypothetical protein ACFNP4_08940, partial [Capnocytophaga gingivalis]